MTYEAELAKQNALKFECKKDGFSQLQSGTTKVSLTIQPEELPVELLKAPMGTRYMCVLVEIGDNEVPVQKPKSFATQAKMMAKDVLINKFIDDNHLVFQTCLTDPEEIIESCCCVESCSELTEGTEAGKNFGELQREFNNWKRAREQEDYYKR